MPSYSSESATAMLVKTSNLLREVNETLARLTVAFDELAQHLPTIVNEARKSEPAQASARPSVNREYLVVNREHTIGNRADTILTPEQVEARLANTYEDKGFYIVSRGLEPGIYTSLAEASRQVVGVPGNSMQKKAVKSQALALYAEMYHNGDIERIR
ncbi:hypothetical protein Agabi119p4_2646 [Agaricus bisporus var. burnettii]|uniref:Ribonuclease H1 N-terminal domain-containing protein n=1 Tax=Agaricus bisporus var. burnettii TaxID=192524 RepID=A0A8H7KKJ2_AGABI|nr:hypothetical protein Agabi119p4_2646 [Agaricus bisporus var. burnettii]